MECGYIDVGVTWSNDFLHIKYYLNWLRGQFSNSMSFLKTRLLFILIIWKGGGRKRIYKQHFEYNEILDHFYLFIYKIIWNSVHWKLQIQNNRRYCSCPRCSRIIIFFSENATMHFISFCWDKTVILIISFMRKYFV